MTAPEESGGAEPAVQAFSIQRDGEEDDDQEDVQALAVQRDGEEDEEEIPEEA